MTDDSEKPAGPYKVVELTTVTDESIEGVLNEWTALGYRLDGIHFATRESSKRPAMAFLIFTRPA
jgi:hypothetical protein